MVQNSVTTVTPNSQHRNEIVILVLLLNLIFHFDFGLLKCHEFNEVMPFNQLHSSNKYDFGNITDADDIQLKYIEFFVQQLSRMPFVI